MKPVTITTQLKKVLKEISRKEPVSSDKEYKMLGVRWYANGLFIKDIKKGSEILANYVYKVEKGDFVYSRLFAWKGSFAIATEEFDGCYVSNEFPCFKVDETKLNLHYLLWYFRQPQIWDSCLEKSEGSTSISRNRFKVGSFLDFSIPLNTLKVQNAIVKRLNFASEKNIEILVIREDSKERISSLRSSILQEAVQGKLVPQDPNDETAIILLEKIKAEKELLIKEKKIKKEKQLPKITEDEMPYELPQGWEWIRLGEIIYSTDAGKSPDCIDEPTDKDKWGVIKTTAIQKDYFLEYQNKVLPQDFPISDSYVINKGDVLITRAGPKNRVGISCCVHEITKKLILSDKTIRLRLSDCLVSHRYISLVLNSPLIRPFIESKMTGMAESQVNISQNNMRWFYIPLPPLAEQIRIGDKVDQLMKMCNELEEKVKQSKTESELLIKSVLEIAFSSA